MRGRIDMIRIGVAIAACIAICMTASPVVADTIHMKNGTQVFGKVVSQTGERVEVRVGDRTVVLRASEIRHREENDKTGRLDVEKVRARVQERHIEIETETGLKTEDLRLIKELVEKLRSRDPLEHEDAYLALARMQKRADVVGYFEGQLSRYTAGFAVPVLEVMYKLDPKRGLRAARDSVSVLAPATRGKAVEILARSDDPDDIVYVVRGLIDPDPRVRIRATHGMRALGERRATPAMLANLRESNAWLRGASSDALAALWGIEPEKARALDADGWEALWESRQSEVANPFRVSRLEPLVNPHEHYIEE